MGIVAFAVGLIVGSFVNVCIYRLPRRESVVWPGSHCPHCQAPIRWYDNIPLLSFALLGGRCRRCRAPI
ncbi:MAG: prepilin peptidase, partial [Bacillati bacterium ANGP1]